MAPVSDIELEGDSGRTISKEDCVCPVCLEIFVEPVTLPCSHTFCKGCFLESVDKATLCCPLCRKRVSTWARQNSRNKTLVNERLWRQIQTTFPLQCERRLSGQEAEDGQTVFFPRLSEPGAVRQEYEDQISKLTEEKRLLQEQERRASEEYIQRLLAEEEQLLQEQQRRHEDDERLAQLLSRELNSARDPQLQSHVPEVTPVKKKLSGQIDRFLSPVLRSPGCSPTPRSNKENIQVQMNTLLELPELDYYPPETNQSERQDTDQSELEDLRVEGGVKRKSREVLTLSEEEEETQGKRSCQSSCLVGVAMAEREAELLQRRKQEEEDRHVALMLQRELDQQQQQTDRRKGSVDAYLLRASRRKQPSASVSTPPAANTQAAKAPKPHTQAPKAPKPHTQTPKAPKPHTQAPKAPKPHTQVPKAPKPHTQTPKAPKPHTQAPKAPKPHTQAPKAPKPHTQAPKTTKQNSPSTPKANRQTTLTDLFALHS